MPRICMQLKEIQRIKTVLLKAIKYKKTSVFILIRIRSANDIHANRRTQYRVELVSTVSAEIEPI
jgi:hypothetical protein